MFTTEGYPGLAGMANSVLNSILPRAAKIEQTMKMASTNLNLIGSGAGPILGVFRSTPFGVCAAAHEAMAQRP